jgi:hypothetical protein
MVAVSLLRKEILDQLPLMRFVGFDKLVSRVLSEPRIKHEIKQNEDSYDEYDHLLHHSAPFQKAFPLFSEHFRTVFAVY